MKKGQVALEFIFIILVIIVYLFTVTKPLTENASEAAKDIEAITRTNLETQKVVNSINRLAMMGDGSQETISIFTPAKSTIRCFPDGNVGFSVVISDKVKPFPLSCPTGTCDKNFPITKSIKVNCLYQTLQGYVRVEKNSGEIDVTQGS